MRVQLPDACTDEAPSMLRITIFMTARRHVRAFWEQASDQAFACTPGQDDAIGSDPKISHLPESS